VLQLKDLRGRSVGERVTEWDGKILKELVRTARRASMVRWAPSFPTRAGICDPDRIGIFDRQGCDRQAEESRRLTQAITAYWYCMSRVTCKWFEYCGIADPQQRLNPEEGAVPDPQALGAIAGLVALLVAVIAGWWHTRSLKHNSAGTPERPDSKPQSPWAGWSKIVACREEIYKYYHYLSQIF